VKRIHPDLAFSVHSGLGWRAVTSCDDATATFRDTRRKTMYKAVIAAPPVVFVPAVRGRHVFNG
jgi:hypothetical protein